MSHALCILAVDTGKELLPSPYVASPRFREGAATVASTRTADSTAVPADTTLPTAARLVSWQACPQIGKLCGIPGACLLFAGFSLLSSGGHLHSIVQH